MNEFLALALALVTGILLGAVFFGGLWWTIRRAVSSQRPALWFSVSMVVRMGIALGGFYFVSGGDWVRLVISLAGFLAARWIVVGLTRTPRERRTLQSQEASHAPQS